MSRNQTISQDTRAVLGYVLVVILGVAMITSAAAISTTNLSPVSNDDSNPGQVGNVVEKGLDETNNMLINDPDTDASSYSAESSIKWQGLNNLGRQNLGSLVTALNSQGIQTGSITKVSVENTEGVDDGFYLSQKGTGEYTETVEQTVYADYKWHDQVQKTRYTTEYHDRVRYQSGTEWVNTGRHEPDSNLAACSPSDQKCEVHTHDTTRYHHEVTESYTASENHVHSGTRPVGHEHTSTSTHCHLSLSFTLGVQGTSHCIDEHEHTSSWTHTHWEDYTSDHTHYETKYRTTTEHERCMTYKPDCSEHTHSETYFHIYEKEPVYDYKTVHRNNDCSGCTSHQHPETYYETVERDSPCVGCTRHQHGTTTEWYEGATTETTTTTETFSSESLTYNGIGDWTVTEDASEYRDSHIIINKNGLATVESKAFTMQTEDGNWSMKVWREPIREGSDTYQIVVETNDGNTNTYDDNVNSIALNFGQNTQDTITADNGDTTNINFAGSDTHDLQFRNADKAYGTYTIASNGDSGLAGGTKLTDLTESSIVNLANDIVYSAEFDVTYESGDTTITERIYVEPQIEDEDN